MNDLQKQRIIETFRMAGKAQQRELFIEAAEMAGFFLGDAEKSGFTRPQAMEIVKQHLLCLADTWREFAESHFERVCKDMGPRISEVEKQ